MQVTLYSNFSKRRNSTKQPTTGGVVKDVKLKGECSYTRPSFFLADVNEYTYLQAWGNYYFIDERLYDINGASYVNCSIDVRASFKTEILATSAFVLYSSSSYNELLVDTRIATLVDEKADTVTAISTLFTTDQCYLLTACNKWGGLYHYVLSKSELNTLLDSLSYDTEDTTLANVFNAVSLQFGDAISAVQSLIRLPVSASKIRTGSNFVGLGAYQVPEAQGSQNWMTADVSEDGWVREIRQLAIPWHYEDFRRERKYTSLTLTLPFIGQVELNPLDFVETDTVEVRTDLCVWTGGITYTIYQDNVLEPVATYKAQCGLEMPLSAVTLGNVKDMVNTISGVGAGLTLGAISSPSVKSLTGIGSAIALSTSLVHMTNQYSAVNMGSYAGTSAEYANKDYELTVRYYPTVEEPDNLRELYGRPCMKVESMSQLTGYVETLGFSIDLNETDEIKRMINEAMDSGTYLE